MCKSPPFVRLFLISGLIAILSTSVYAADPAPAEAVASVPISDEDIRTFVSVFRTIKDAYVEPVADDQLMHAAIRGMLSHLDPHSQYLEPSELQQWDEDTSGVYGGLGVEVLMVDGFLRVIAPIDDSPASRAGVKSGDIILAIDGIEMQGNDLNAVDKLRGPVGSRVKLTLDRETESAPVVVDLMREVIRTRSVKGRLLQPGYAYLRISQFQETSPRDLSEQLRKLHTSKKPLRGLVLDLRNNPGGVLNAAVETVDAFLDEGLIVSTRGRIDEAKLSLSASPGDLIDGASIVVLVDAGSASASEIVAGALQDHHRAVIMGKRTFGKGSVQNILPLESGGAIKLTTARYFTPAGHSIQAQGIVPDIELAEVQLAPLDRAAQLLSTEAGLPGHLETPGVSIGEVQAAAEPLDEALHKDYALSAALNALKAMVIAKRPAATQAR
ncbi:MAG: S41 family peptidase [Pseudomonadota bacterium]|nr:S41 family peptidase [Pseudomonadota bacterium]